MTTFVAWLKARYVEMAKQQKYNLFVDEECNYDLIGICSHHRDYRLVWGLNELLKLQLVKSNDEFVVGNKKGGVISKHPYYIQEDPDFGNDIYLIKNKVDGKYLIPENQQIDYFLFLLDNQLVDLDAWVEKLKSHASVLTAFTFDPSDFKSTENILF